MASLKARIATCELTIGSWLSFSDPAVCEVMAKAGFDWLVIDMEHTAIETSQAQHLIQIIDLAGCVPLVRVGCNGMNQFGVRSDCVPAPAVTEFGPLSLGMRFTTLPELIRRRKRARK